VESVLGVVTAVTSESIGAVVSVSPADFSGFSVPPSIPSSISIKPVYSTSSVTYSEMTGTHDLGLKSER